MSEIAFLIQAIETGNHWESEKIINRNEFLKFENETDLNIYFIVEGCLRLFIVDENYEHIIRFGYKNNIVAALDSYISEAPSDLNIQAIRRTIVKVISKSKFIDIIKQSDQCYAAWQIILEQLIYQQLEREKDILIHSPVKRYQRVLSRSPQLFQEVPHKYIASYLRMTPETLSRLKSAKNEIEQVD
jgi:CRP-like cAMP-binding protein